mgnify:CR=1 FL=1
MENTSIIACDIPADIGRRVILWSEKEGYSFYKKYKYYPRSSNLDILRKEIKTLVYHHTATFTAKDTFSGMNARGLSVNFLIDDDEEGIIYQCLDIKDAGWSHTILNKKGPGVEICYQPLVSKTPNAYTPASIASHGVQPHTQAIDKIHGVNFKVFCPTQAQVDSCVALAKGFKELFPDVPMEFPKDKNGNITRDVVKGVQNYTGLLGHLHIDPQKIDPAGFPFEEIENKLNNSVGYYNCQNSIENANRK